MRRAFVDSLPVLMGYSTMGFVAGVLLAAKGAVAFAPVWAFLTSFFWVTGTMSFAIVPELAARAPLLSIALLTLAVNFRYAFYGFSLLARWRGVPFWRKSYLILMLTDENYALECASPLKDPKRHLAYCTFLSVMNHSYWVAGVTTGAAVVALLGRAVDPEDIRRWTNGMEFAMAALFLVIFADQIRGIVRHEK
jgi:4-azaleucine resistance transporter AzlC